MITVTAITSRCLNSPGQAQRKLRLKRARLMSKLLYANWGRGPNFNCCPPTVSPRDSTKSAGLDTGGVQIEPAFGQAAGYGGSLRPNDCAPHNSSQAKTRCGRVGFQNSIRVRLLLGEGWDYKMTSFHILS